MKQCPWRQQVALVKHALRQRIGVHARIHPAKQPCGLRGKAAARRKRQLDAARAGRVKPRTNALGMSAQLALFNTQRQCFLQQGGGRQCRQQLGVEQLLDQRRWCSQIADAPVGRQDLGKAAHVDRALQAI